MARDNELTVHCPVTVFNKKLTERIWLITGFLLLPAEIYHRVANQLYSGEAGWYAGRFCLPNTAGKRSH